MPRTIETITIAVKAGDCANCDQPHVTVRGTGAHMSAYGSWPSSCGVLALLGLLVTGCQAIESVGDARVSPGATIELRRSFHIWFGRGVMHLRSDALGSTLRADDP